MGPKDDIVVEKHHPRVKPEPLGLISRPYDRVQPVAITQVRDSEYAMNYELDSILRGDSLLDIRPGSSGVSREQNQVDFHGGVNLMSVPARAALVTTTIDALASRGISSPPG
jgi:hypothetical protein